MALRRSWGETFDRVLAADIPERLALAKELASEERITDILDEWIGLTRSALLPAGQAEPKTVTHLRKRYSQEQLSDHLHRLFAARRRLRYNPNVQLLIEQLLLRLA